VSGWLRGDASHADIAKSKARPYSHLGGRCLGPRERTSAIALTEIAGRSTAGNDRVAIDQESGIAVLVME
jgi:hypothetical protein